MTVIEAAYVPEYGVIHTRFFYLVYYQQVK